jgi:hypothetical protein
MIKAKNSIGEYRSALTRPDNRFWPFIKLKIEPVNSTTAKKLKTRSNLFIFLTTRRPPITTNGIIYRLATHQLADWLATRPTRATDTATGFKKCFLPTAKIYFDAIATIDINVKNNKLLNAFGGVIIRAKISAVI